MTNRVRTSGTMNQPDGALVGREDLVDELTGLGRDAARGAGALVLLTGDAGIGKTSVVRAVARRLRDELAATWGTCVADLGAPPFWPWRAMVDVETVGTGRIADEPADEAIGAQRFERLNQLRHQIVARAGSTPSLHVIEDLQWADVASILLLGHLGSSIADVPLLVVGTLRNGEPLGRQVERAIEDVRRTAIVRAVTPLGEDAVAGLMHSAGVGADRALATLVHERTRGNPLFVTELLRAARAGDRRQDLRDALAASVPSRVSELVAHRLARMPAPIGEIVVSASVIGTSGDVSTLAALRGSSVESALDLLEQARAAGLVELPAPGQWQFRHDLVRDAIYGDVAPAVRSRLHGETLEVLAADGCAPPAVLARHALAAQPLFDTDRAVALAARAGEAAFAQHGYEEAVAWFDRALAAAPLTTSSRWRAELLVLSGEAHRQAGAIEAARTALVAAAALTDDPGLLARAALAYADPGADLGIAYRTDDATTAELLERAIAAQPDGDSTLTVSLEARLAAILYFSDEPSRSRSLVEAAVERARRLDDQRARCVAGAVAHDGFVVGQADLDQLLRGSDQLLEWARASGSAAALLTAHRARVFDLLAAGDIAGMDTEIVAFSRVADPLGVPGYQWWPALWHAMRALLEGRHDTAEARAMTAYGIGERPFPSLALLNMSFLLFFLRREQGRLAEMEQATRDFVASRADIPALRVGLAFLLAESGRIDEAGGMLAEIHEALLDRLHDRNWPASWFQLARAAALVGDRDLAATLLDDRHRPAQRCVTVSLATVCLGAADLATAWLLHTTGDLDAADERYASARAINARIGARSWLAQAQADHARLLLDRNASGDHDQAQQLLDLVKRTCADGGPVTVQPLVDQLLARLGGRVTDVPGPRGDAPMFRRAGAVWDLAFGDRRVQIPHSRGLRDVAHLLARPGESVSVLELLDEPSAAALGRGAPVLDDRARNEIRSRLRALDAEVADAEAADDGERAARAREQLQQLAEAVARDLGLGGRSRRIGDPVERARKTVSTRIHRAIAQVDRAHPELGRHLARSIDTGAWCAYRPAEPVRWIT